MSSPSSVPISFDGMAGQFDGALIALNGTEGASAGAPDTLTLRFQGTNDNATVDCLGNVIGAGAIATNIFSVETVNGVSSLVCRTAAAGVPTVLVSDVDNMQIVYGEEAGSVWNADRYVPSDLVSDMNHVMSVRMALLFRTASQRMRTTPDTTAYNLLGTTLPVFTGAEATRIRRVMTVTFAMRNRSP
jgi:hypothetical protein